MDLFARGGRARQVGEFQFLPKRDNPSPDSATEAHPRKTKNRRRLTACGGQVGAPHELLARPPLSPLFHLYTLAPLYLRPQSGRPSKIPLLDFSRT
jgi:hypothetical protein